MSERTMRLPGLTPWGRWISTGCRLVLGVIWAWAGLAKIGDPDAAVRAVRAYRLLPEALVHVVAWGLPFGEIALGVVLLMGLGTRIAAVISLALLAIYVGAIGSAWARGLQIECGCFGGGGVTPGIRWTNYVLEIVRDLGFSLPAAWLVARPESRFAVGSGAP